MNNHITPTRCLAILTLAALLIAGCKSADTDPTNNQTVTFTTTAAMNATASIHALQLPIRIKAGADAPFTDAAGNVWLPDQGFVGGDVADRGSDLPIANTADPALYRTEHYSMDSFSVKLPNGPYVVKLHFAETFEEITEPGQRVFSFKVNGQEFKDFDVCAKAGGPHRAYVETVNVAITTGQLDIVFTPNIENPEINGIEILPVK